MWTSPSPNENRRCGENPRRTRSFRRRESGSATRVRRCLFFDDDDGIRGVTDACGTCVWNVRVERAEIYIYSQEARSMVVPTPYPPVSTTPAMDPLEPFEFRYVPPRGRCEVVTVTMGGVR